MLLYVFSPSHSPKSLTSLSKVPCLSQLVSHSVLQQLPHPRRHNPHPALFAPNPIYVAAPSAEMPDCKSSVYTTSGTENQHVGGGGPVALTPFSIRKQRKGFMMNPAVNARGIRRVNPYPQRIDTFFFTAVDWHCLKSTSPAPSSRRRPRIAATSLPTSVFFQASA